ncbi:MAG: hypothetical protein E7012_01945 [Alphaproteobacteria bacterium]|nr:hypothetical protein [Alphaproteobacteria bacterium]
MKILFTKIFAITAVVLIASDAIALDIPSYIKDPQDVNSNTDIIIKENTPVRDNSETVTDWTEKTRKLLAQSATQLYAEAISTRAQMVGTLPATNSSSGAIPLPGGVQKIYGEGKALMSKLSSLSKDNNSVLQNEVKNYVKNIALNVKRIAVLEGAINYLEGLQTINNVAISLETEEDTDEEK